MVEVYRCPLCGRVQNRHGKPFTTRGHTVGHIDGSRDDLHHDESGLTYRSEMEAEEVPEEELEPPEPSYSGVGGDSIPTVSDPFIEGEETPVTESVEFHGEALEQPEAFGLVSGKEFAELEEKVERQQEVIRELTEVVEFLGRQAEGESDSDSYPWEWENETLNVKTE